MKMICTKMASHEKLKYRQKKTSNLIKQKRGNRILLRFNFHNVHQKQPSDYRQSFEHFFLLCYDALCNVLKNHF